MLDGDESKKEWTYNDYFRIKALLYSKYNLVNNLWFYYMISLKV